MLTIVREKIRSKSYLLSSPSLVNHKSNPTARVEATKVNTKLLVGEFKIGILSDPPNKRVKKPINEAFQLDEYQIIDDMVRKYSMCSSKPIPKTGTADSTYNARSNCLSITREIWPWLTHRMVPGCGASAHLSGAPFHRHD